MSRGSGLGDKMKKGRLYPAVIFMSLYVIRKLG